MVEGAKRSRSMKRVASRKPGGKTVIEYIRARPGPATCPSGRALPGTARGTKIEVGKLTKTQRRPSRPYGGVLSSPALRHVMLGRAQEAFEAPESKSASVLSLGTVCMKLAGRDAGKLCVVTERIDANFVKIDGQTRARKVNIKHIEPIGRHVDLKKHTDSKAIQAALSA